MGIQAHEKRPLPGLVHKLKLEVKKGESGA
jgi:hypothetical protein